MSESDVHVVVRALYDAYAARDFERVGTLIHEDVDWIIYAPVNIFPYAGQRRGRPAVVQALAGVAEVYNLEGYQREIMVVEGDRAAVMADVHFRQRATQRLLRFRVANFMRISQGQLIEFREFTNTFDLVEQAMGHELPI